MFPQALCRCKVGEKQHKLGDQTHTHTHTPALCECSACGVTDKWNSCCSMKHASSTVHQPHLNPRALRRQGIYLWR